MYQNYPLAFKSTYSLLNMNAMKQSKQSLLSEINLETF